MRAGAGRLMGIDVMLGALARKIFGSANDRRLKTYAPKVAGLAIYVLMALVLLWRPTGLFGQRT